MGLFNFRKKIKESAIVDLEYKPSLSGDFANVTEQFKGQVEKKDIKFPNELGEEHPFDFKIMEELCKKFGMYNAVLDKYNDFIWGSGFYTVCEDERAKTIIDDFIIDIDLPTIGRAWTKEGLNKGNGFLEIGGDVKEGIKGLKTLNANYMYVNRDKLGKVLGYKQYTGAFEKFSKEKIIPFAIDNIAHFAFNVIGDNAYGIGIGYPAMKDIDNLLANETDMHKIYHRKANSPLHAKLGKVEGDIKIIPSKADVTAFGQLMETMDNKTDWATDALVELSVVDFGNIGEKFNAILEHDMQKLLYDFQIPPELMGMANIPEGMARVRMEAFQKRIQSIQAELEKIIEQKIFKRVLNANGLDVEVEFEWGTPSIMEVEGRLKLITELIKSMTTSPSLREILEDELVDMLDLDKDKFEELKTADEEARRREEERNQPIIPGQNKSFPQKPQPIVPTNQIKPIIPKREKYVNKNYEYAKECKHCQESWNDVNDIEEWLGFKYTDYIKQILAEVKQYDFSQIKAETTNEELAGYLSEEQINRLKDILENGFKKGLSMKNMAEEVDRQLDLKDLYRMTEDGDVKRGVSGLPILQKSKENRSISIVRSEVTRLANMGAVDYYKENGIEKVRWVASYGERTCPDCEALNGQIYEIGQEEEMPLHPFCRCAYAPVVEIK